MTDDIVKRLRYGLIDTNTSYRYQQEAADEIERLRAENKRTRSLLHWDIAEDEEGLIICDGNHEKRLYRQSTVDELRAENAELREQVEKLRAAGEGVVKWWLDDGCLPFDGAPHALFALRKALGHSRDKAALDDDS